MPDRPTRLTADDPLSGLTRWLAEGRVDAAAAERASQRWLERQAAEDASVAGVLVELAERGAPIAIRTTGAHIVRGCIVALGTDFVAVRAPHRGDVFVPRAAIATVRPGPGERAAVGDRAASFELVLAHALVELSAQRPTVLVGVAGEELRGEMHTAGNDVVALTVTGDRRDVIHVAIAAIDHLVVLHG